MSLLLPTATQATPTIRYRLIIYKEWVAEVEVFVAKKVFYYIGKNPLYATGDYRQRMEGVFIKAKQHCPLSSATCL